MNLDLENTLENNPEYRRILNALSPNERLQFFGENFSLEKQLDRKKNYRQILAKLSPSEKLRLLEELRRRAQLQKGKRRTLSPHLSRINESSELVSQRKLLGGDSNAGTNRFGGRATSSGVNYEIRIASFIAVKMLAGKECVLWKGVTGADISSITLQAPEAVDDIVIDLSESKGRAFISAKKRSNAVALSQTNLTFTSTVEAFVKQFEKINLNGKKNIRLVWATPENASHALSRDLKEVLDVYRQDAGNDKLADFLKRRPTRERRAFRSFASIVAQKWKAKSGKRISDPELYAFLRSVYVETFGFDQNGQHKREALENIRSHIVADANDANLAWEKIEFFFANANEKGLKVTRTSLLNALSEGGLKLKSPTDYAAEIKRLTQLTDINFLRLEQHTTLPFKGENLHVPRKGELSALVDAAKKGHLMIVGEPGCGKSGIVHELVQTLKSENHPVVLLLAEEVLNHDWKGAANIADFDHPLDEVLANWPDRKKCFFITDALDAVRDAEIQKRLRQLLSDVRSNSNWTVIATVREYDLQYGRELREIFPGAGIEGNSSKAFAGVAHFFLRRFAETQLDELVARRSEIGPFVVSARKNSKSEDVHRSPFYLRLAAELLRDGEDPSRLADWSSPAILFRKFWDVRIKGSAGSDLREVVLKKICEDMVNARTMAVSLKRLSLGAPERMAINELRGLGILQPPAMRLGSLVGEDELRFAHHLLHDYAIARCLIPETPTLFFRFAIERPLLPIFYRQSFLFALEELWDVQDNHEGFWEVALNLEGEPELHSIARILAPVLAARRVVSASDLKPLYDVLAPTKDANSPAFKALQHLASGFQDVDPNMVRAGLAAWSEFSEQISGLLSENQSLEMSLVQILGRLNAIENIATDISQRRALNVAGRRLLALHTFKEISQYRRYFVHVAIRTLCKTYDSAPPETEAALLTLLVPDRLEKFPHDDLYEFANSVGLLPPEGDNLILELFKASFNSDEPAPGEYEDNGSAILSLRFQSRDQWNMVQYALSEYYLKRDGQNAAFMTAAVCIAWNSKESLTKERVLTTFRFRNVDCVLVEDYSHISGRGYEQNENRILTHFEALLRGWAATPDNAKLNIALDAFIRSNRSSLLWTVFLEIGALFPSSLGILLEDVLKEPIFLTHPDYTFGGAALLGGLHSFGDNARRERLENLILNLPKTFSLIPSENRDPLPEYIQYIIDRLLSTLKDENIVLQSVKNLRLERQAVTKLPKNERPSGPQVHSRPITNEERFANIGVDLKQPENDEMFHLQEKLKFFNELQNNKTIEKEEINKHWAVIEQCLEAIRQYSIQQPSMVKDLWGHLVGACEKMASLVTIWPKTDEKWKTIRQIILKASSDSSPVSYDDDKDENWPSWTWPAPRLDAARALPFLALRLGNADKNISSALRRLSTDNSVPLRFNLAERLAPLAKVAPNLMWELFDTFLAHEKKMSVLEMLSFSLDRLWAIAPEKVKPRFRQLVHHVMKYGPIKHHIYESLGSTYLFQFLRTGDTEYFLFVANLIDECESERASRALTTMLHNCRAGGWFTAGDAIKPDEQADKIRNRTWDFMARVLESAQTKLHAYRIAFTELNKKEGTEAEAAKGIKEKLDRCAHLVDAVAMQLFFACGAFNEHSKEKVVLTKEQLCRFWRESKHLFEILAEEPHPHIAYQNVQTLYQLLPCAPRDIFLLATKMICNSSKQARFQYESLAVGEVVKLIQRVLADYREIFNAKTGHTSECLLALLQVLDLFVDAGWPEARQLTHRLEEIYR